MDREALFDRVWSEPVSKLAEEWGLSGPGLARPCRRLHVPVPPGGSGLRCRLVSGCVGLSSLSCHQGKPKQSSSMRRSDQLGTRRLPPTRLLAVGGARPSTTWRRQTKLRRLTDSRSAEFCSRTGSPTAATPAHTSASARRRAGQFRSTRSQPPIASRGSNASESGIVLHFPPVLWRTPPLPGDAG